MPALHRLAPALSLALVTILAPARAAIPTGHALPRPFSRDLHGNPDRPPVTPPGIGQRHKLPPPPPVPPRVGLPPRCITPTTTGEALQVTIQSPLPGDTTTSYEPNCPTGVTVTGTASVGLIFADLYFVIDTSGSTARCTGSDIDGDGVVGVPDPFNAFACSDDGDTVIAAEVKAVRDFVATLSPVITRVAIIQFSMPESASPALGQRQRVVVSLTSDFVAVGAGLDDIIAAGPAGATDYGGAVQLLLAEKTANGDPAHRRQHCYFLSDGVPTYPAGSLGFEDAPDSQWALDQTDIAIAQGVRLDTFGVGFIPSTTMDPIIPERCLKDTPSGPVLVSTLECMAIRSGGEFFASSNPADIVDRLRLSQPAGIESVTIANETNGQSVPATLTPDGTWTGSVPLVLGVINNILVTVVAADGTTCLVRTDFLALCFSDGCAPLTQGYWHRQCMGLGLIPPNGGGGGPPPHPDWDPAVLLQVMAAIVDPQVRALGSPPDQTTCEGLDADPPSDMCQKAIKQYTAVLMNITMGKLGPSCVLQAPNVSGTNAVDAAAQIALLIEAGLAGDPTACQRANDAADAINTGAALR